MKISIGKRPEPFRILKIAAAALLAIAAIAACGGSGGDVAKVGGGGVVTSPPPPPPPPPPPASCTAEQNAAAWETLACPAGMLCVGEIYGNAVANISVLTSGSRPDWSPDGTQIVFEERHSGGISRINADGSGETMLAEGREPAWSPVDARIAFRNDEGIAVINVDGTSKKTLIRHDFAYGPNSYISSPAWSPDGQRIVFVEHGDSMFIAPQLYTMDSDGKDARKLGQRSLAAFADPAWSPDGGSIAFMRDASLATVDTAGGAFTIIVHSTGYVYARPDWTVDGSTISFTAQGKCMARGIRTIGSQGGAVVELLAGAQQAAWSPDGTRLAFASAAGAYPPVAKPASVYDRAEPDSFGSRSRYVIYDDGTFELQIASLQGGVWSVDGTYDRDLDTFQFAFDNDPVSESYRWRAAGTLDGTRLSIKYNEAARWHDFEDAVYVLSETQQ